MIKNRESACLSRKKKKEYVTNLEDQLNALARENQQLKSDNESLRQRILELEAEKSRHWGNFSKALSGANARKATALLAIFCVVSLNVGTFTNVHQHNDPMSRDQARARMQQDKSSFAPVSVQSRSLLWDTTPEANGSATLDPKCSMYFNQSESIRLDKLLRGLFQSDEAIANVTTKNAPITPVRSPKRTKPYETSLGPYEKPQARGLTGGFYQMLISNPESRTGITIYDEETPRFTYDSFFEAIHRREDTFYVVSFSGDHLLLPASARNESSRPRMSLLLPSVTVPLNGERFASSFK